MCGVFNKNKAFEAVTRCLRIVYSAKQVYAMHSFYSVQSCLVVFVSRNVFN